jgi:Flp pilus assembly protein TadD
LLAFVTGSVEHLRKSESYARKSLSLDPTNHAVWNLLGVIAFEADNHRLAQHAFIKSVTTESNSTAWTNLGILYLVLG